MPFYVTKFTVYPMYKVSRPFPIDMLRRDHCYPVHENEAHIIQRSIAHTLEEGEAVAMIQLAHIGSNKLWQPTIGRWQSFGWDVADLSISVEKLNP